MKHATLGILVLAALVLVPCAALAGNFVFSVSPGQAVESGQVGCTMGSFMPYLGFDVLGIAGKGTYHYDDTNTYGSDQYRTVEDTEMKGSATLFIPHLGARFYFAKKEIRPYVFADLLKSFAFVSASGTERTNYYLNGTLVDSYSDDYEVTAEAKDQIQKALGFWGVSAGFGCEYPFSEHFVLGGEYLLRYFHTTTKGTTRTGGGAGDSYSTAYTDELSGSLKLSTGRVWLNYRF